MFGPPPTTLTLEVALDPVRVRERLRESMSPVRSFLLSPTSGADRPFVGQLQERAFRLRVHRGSSNGLTRLLYGTLIPRAEGTTVVAEFRTLRWVVWTLRGADLLIIGLAAPVALEVARTTEPGAGGGGLFAALLAPLLVVGFMVAIECVARGMGTRDEQRLREHLTALFADVRAGSQS
jgi:hypothetical protein